MSDINPDVLAQMKRIWSAVNDGTLDKGSVNDALAKMADFLTGAAYEVHDPDFESDKPAVEPEELPEPEEAEEPHPNKRKRRKR